MQTIECNACNDTGYLDKGRPRPFADRICCPYCNTVAVEPRPFVLPVRGVNSRPAARQPVPSGTYGRCTVMPHPDTGDRRRLSLSGYYNGFDADEMRELAHFLNQLAESMDNTP